LYYHRRERTAKKLDLMQGTLDVMVLQTLSAMGSLHGYGIARRIEQISGNQVLLNQGTIYASLVRLQQRGWIEGRSTPSFRRLRPRNEIGDIHHRVPGSDAAERARARFDNPSLISAAVPAKNLRITRQQRQ